MDYSRLKESVRDLENRVLRRWSFAFYSKFNGFCTFFQQNPHTQSSFSHVDSEMRRQELEQQFEFLMRDRNKWQVSLSRPLCRMHRFELFLYTLLRAQNTLALKHLHLPQ